ncbi:hypothetical protein ASE63_21945 [Bosea sp. Root381]|uniref:aldo/keto reductase n=1 Tax=Bosea sp. Root381 TaxID=1736524 RepID=UPI0006F7857A|nr:aldo/keto reductase [Bosea sp. Root381]KRE07998.1 hypothetical protein ASE63_21945 [Bosea sp. Root381]
MEYRQPGSPGLRPPVESEHNCVIEALEAVTADTGHNVPQIAVNWLLGRPTISSVIVGARNEDQLRQIKGARAWPLTPAQIIALAAANAFLPPYPHTPDREQAGFARLAPAPV